MSETTFQFKWIEVSELNALSLTGIIGAEGKSASAISVMSDDGESPSSFRSK